MPPRERPTETAESPEPEPDPELELDDPVARLRAARTAAMRAQRR
jgi:hypothetical protein